MPGSVAAVAGFSVLGGQVECGTVGGHSAECPRVVASASISAPSAFFCRMYFFSPFLGKQERLPCGAPRVSCVPRLLFLILPAILGLMHQSQDKLVMGGDFLTSTQKISGICCCERDWGSPGGRKGLDPQLTPFLLLLALGIREG